MPTLVSITSPLNDTQLSLVSMEGHEALSQPFDYTVTLLSTISNVDFTTVLGQPIVITFTQPDGSTQFLNGVVTEFAQEGQDAALQTTYRARLRPSFWLLSMHSEYTIYQTKSFTDIIEAVFSARGFTAFKNSTTGSYSAMDYIVQYGESSMDFVSRLMETAGIFYFFTHTASANTLVLADDASSYAVVPGTSTIPFGHVSDQQVKLSIAGSIEQRLVPAGYKVNDYNFTTPTTALLSTSGDSADKYQLSEFPGGYLTKSDGETLASLRLTALEAEAKVLRGSSNSSSFHVGLKFTLSEHPRADVNGDWVVTRMNASYQGGLYQNEFEAIPAATSFRPLRLTPRPRVHGTQTALVTGKSGEEIWTDSYGRIKVKFPWDGSTATDDTTSCWIRVSQSWAGKAYGSLFTPRVGAEVIISFLNGDPEQPLVVGTVYNAAQTMPYTLPGDQTKSTIKTYSSKGGAGYNELRFEDKAGSEEVYLQAQQDLNVNVVKGNHSITVATGNETHTVKGTRGITITGKETRTNQADFEQDTTGNYTLKVSGNLTISATGSISLKSGTSFELKGGTSTDVESGTGMTVKAGTSLDASSGTGLTAKGGTTLDLEGAATATLKGGAQTAIKGGIVQIN